MDSIRKEIEAEMRRARLDKGRLYDLLLKIVDSGVGGGAGAQGPQGPVGPAGPVGPVGAPGAAGVCKCTCPCSKEEKPKVSSPKAATAKPAAKKTTTTTKKKTVSV
jgi:hypothetical protein